jgi:hypothetical protein
MLDQLKEAKQKELNSIDRTVQIKRKSDDSVINENEEKLAEDDSSSKKTRTDNQNDRKIVSMHAKYSKFVKILNNNLKLKLKKNS